MIVRIKLHALTGRPTNLIYCFQDWTDERLLWNTSAFDVDAIFVQRHDIWVPDIVVKNRCEYTDFIIFTARCYTQSAVMPQYVVCPSVGPSVCVCLVCRVCRCWQSNVQLVEPTPPVSQHLKHST